MEKLMIYISIVVTVFVFHSTGTGQTQKGTDTVTIQTSAVCGMCKDRIEKGLAFEKGIRNVVLDDKTKAVSVKYQPEKTSPSAIRMAISNLGYDADTIPADPKAYAKLPACCKKDAPPH